MTRCHVGRQLAKAIWGAALLLTMASEVAAQATVEITEAKKEFLWSSTGKTAKEFSAELGALYLTLFNSGRLTVRPYTVPQDMPIEGILRANTLLIGPIFPIEIDSVICELNSHICSREKIPASPSDANSPARVVGSINSSGTTVPTKGHWSIVKAGTALVLPAIRLERTLRWVSSKKAASQSLEEIVVRDLGGCERLDERCKNDILSHNRKADAAVFEPVFEGTLSLPVIAAKATVDFTSASDLKTQPARQEGRPGANIVLVPSKSGNDLFKVVTDQKVTAGKPSGAFDEKSVIQELQRNVIGGAKFAVPFGQTLIASDFAAFQSDLDKLIAFPFRKLTDYPDQMKKAKVAVFDSWVDHKHCAFPSSRFQFHNINPADEPAPTGSSNCNALETSTPEKDHGTHVAGLIGAAHEQGLSFGLNPFAKVTTYEISFSDLADPKKLGKLAADVSAVRSGDNSIDVVNMSFGYMMTTGDLLQPGVRVQDPIESAIEGLKDSVLFVIAAGNDGANKSNICDLRPACFDLPNVISVAALDRSPDKPSLFASGDKPITNYGKHVHVGAVGENVFSTIPFGRYGTLSGSSQAAPQVAAVASLMMSKYSKQTPLEIKNRLIYCSDFVGAFEGKLFGGRLNSDCAMDGDDARVRLANMPAGASALRGRFQTGLLHFNEGFSGREIALPIQSIRALHFDPKMATYIVFYSLEGTEKDSTLLRESNLVPSVANESLLFIPNDGDPLTIRVADIVKYVSSIK